MDDLLPRSSGIRFLMRCLTKPRLAGLVLLAHAFIPIVGAAAETAPGIQPVPKPSFSIVSSAQPAQVPATQTEVDPSPAIVFVPGVTGSRLENPSTGVVIWGNAAQVFSPKDRGHSTVLPLNTDDYSDQGIKATGVLSHLRLLAFTKEIYRPLRRFLEREGYELGDLGQPSENHDLYLFSYDWRRENQNAVEELHRALSEMTAARGNPNVRLICQSNAGRICRYLAKYGDADPETMRAALARLSLEGGGAAATNGTDAETESIDEGGQVLEALPYKPLPYKIEQLVLISNSHGGSLRQLHELHSGRKYVPGIGRFMGPESLFALRTLFEDLPFYRKDLFLDQDGSTIDIDLFDPAVWQRYQWSIFNPSVEAMLESKDPTNMFGTRADRIEYLEQRLAAAQIVNELLMSDSPLFESRLCLLQNTTVDTYERAVLIQQADGEWHLLFAGDRGLPRDLQTPLSSPGDGHGTEASQNYLSVQEQEAVTNRHAISGGHFDTITRKDTLAKVRACLSE